MPKHKSEKPGCANSQSEMCEEALLPFQGADVAR